jgi:hypothetical protein
MVVRIAGKRMYLWRAVDHEGEVLDMLVQRRRDKHAALRLVRKLLRQQSFVPKLLTTDKLGSYNYGSAFRHLCLTCPHQQGRWANNRAENSHRGRVRPQHRPPTGPPRTADKGNLPDHLCRLPPDRGERRPASRMAIGLRILCRYSFRSDAPVEHQYLGQPPNIQRQQNHVKKQNRIKV